MEIEFIVDAAESASPGPAPEAEAERRSPRRWADLAAAALFAAAAALASLGPFRAFYRISLGEGGFRQSLSYDGWGTLAITPATVENSGQHGARYGIVFVVLAGSCVLVAGVLVSAAIRSVPARVRAATLVAAPVVCAGIGAAVAMAWLDSTASIDSARQITRPDIGRTLGDSVHFDARYGPFLWLELAALGCALAGTALAARAVLRRRVPEPPPSPPPPPPPPSPVVSGGPTEDLAW